MNEQKPLATVQGNGRGTFVVGKVEVDFVFVFYRDPDGDPPNQTKAFRADASEVPHVGDTIYDEDAFRGVRLERVWAKNLSEAMQKEFCKCSGVKCMQDLIWAPGQKPTLQVA